MKAQISIENNDELFAPARSPAQTLLPGAYSGHLNVLIFCRFVSPRCRMCSPSAAFRAPDGEVSV
jgi:hypothetical protein